MFSDSAMVEFLEPRTIHYHHEHDATKLTKATIEFVSEKERRTVRCRAAYFAYRCINQVLFFFLPTGVRRIRVSGRTLLMIFPHQIAEVCKVEANFMFWCLDHDEEPLQK